MGKRNDIPDKSILSLCLRLFCEVGVDNALVQLQIIHRNIGNIFQRRITGTKIIQTERYMGILQLLKQPLSNLVVLEEHALRKFQLNQR